jgi:hypothetical protein
MVSTDAINTATGILFIYYCLTGNDIYGQHVVTQNFKYPYFAISLALNILLTFMIITRLVLRSRGIFIAMGAPVRTTGWWKAAVTLVIESSTLYIVGFLLFLIPWVAESPVADIFMLILAETQVRIAQFSWHNALGSSLSDHGNDS